MTLQSNGHDFDFNNNKRSPSLSPSLATSFNSSDVNFQQRNVTPTADGPKSGIPIQWSGKVQIETGYEF